METVAVDNMVSTYSSHRIQPSTQDKQNEGLVYSKGRCHQDASAQSATSGRLLTLCVFAVAMAQCWICGVMFSAENSRHKDWVSEWDRTSGVDTAELFKNIQQATTQLWNFAFLTGLVR